MKVLVAYASRHGATRGIAERIAERLGRQGLTVDLQPAVGLRDWPQIEAWADGIARELLGAPAAVGS